MLAALFLHAVINVSAMYGSNYPAHGYLVMAAFWMELILTMGLVSVILGTASGAQNVGIIGAFGVGGYIALAGLWGSPISGASMNPARTFGPDLVSTTFTGYWVYIAGPLAGAVWPSSSPSSCVVQAAASQVPGRPRVTSSPRPIRPVSRRQPSARKRSIAPPRVIASEMIRRANVSSSGALSDAATDRGPGGFREPVEPADSQARRRPTRDRP